MVTPKADGINDPGNFDGDKERRINWGWFATIPRQHRVSYDAFATQVAIIIEELHDDLGHGLRVQWFQIGNEYTLDHEYEPTGDGCPAQTAMPSTLTGVIAK